MRFSVARRETDGTRLNACMQVFGQPCNKHKHEKALIRSPHVQSFFVSCRYLSSLSSVVLMSAFLLEIAYESDETAGSVASRPKP